MAHVTALSGIAPSYLLFNPQRILHVPDRYNVQQVHTFSMRIICYKVFMMNIKPNTDIDINLKRNVNILIKHVTYYQKYQKKDKNENKIYEDGKELVRVTVCHCHFNSAARAKT